MGSTCNIARDYSNQGIILYPLFSTQVAEEQGSAGGGLGDSDYGAGSPHSSGSGGFDSLILSGLLLLAWVKMRRRHSKPSG